MRSPRYPDNLTNSTQCYAAGGESGPIQVMFDRIAPSYDLLNHVLSFSMDHRWRRRAVALAEVGAGESVLDLCCGTGDLALEFARSEPRPGRVVGVDFSAAMLRLAEQKSDRRRLGGPAVEWRQGDVADLDVAAGSFDCVSCAFGVRNVARPRVALGRAFEALRKDGRIVVLEFALPENRLLGWLYQCYFRIVLPVIGSVLSQGSGGAYRYLPRSVGEFHAERVLSEWVAEAGFVDVSVDRMCGGTVLAVKGYRR